MGYRGFSESERSYEAKCEGRHPLSYWTKGIVLDKVEKMVSPEVFKAMKKTRWSALRTEVLRCTEWHHTGKMFNCTDFYALDEDAIEALTVEKLASADEWAKEVAAKEKAAKANPEVTRVRAHYLEWGGTRAHPKAKDVVEEGTITGNWFTSVSGVRKSTHANGFYVLETL